MTKTLSALAILAFFSISFTACKKEKAQTASERIIGKWQMSKLVYNIHTNGADNIISTTVFTANDAYEFRKDGTVYQSYQGQSDSFTYTLTGENKLTITDDDTYDIKTLDDHTLILYSKAVSGNDYEEITITFKR